MVRDNRDALKQAAARWAVMVRRPLTIALAGALLGGGLYLGNRAYVAATSPTSCPVGCVTNGTLSISSDPVMQATENQIAALNATATAGPYYSVVLLDPFTYSPSGTVSQSRMTDELKGAYLALKAANATAASKHTGAAIQLLLANEGTSAEEGEGEAVRQIENLIGPDRIAAVAGMGLSTANTETAATALSAFKMPMFGAVTTGDQFDDDNYPGFFQIVPAVAAQVDTLVTGLQGQQSVALISSDQKSDIYSADLQTGFLSALGYRTPLGYFSFDPAMAEQQFASYATTICARQKMKYAGTALTVLYAGRETALPALVGQFQQAYVCRKLTVTIVTGSDSNALPASVTAGSGLTGANVIVKYSDIESVAHLSNIRTISPRVSDFQTSPPEPGACANQQYDPWTVATYNSVMAAAYTESQAGTYVPASVLLEAKDLETSLTYPAPYGKFGFTSQGQLQGSVIPVYTESNGKCSP